MEQLLDFLSNWGLPLVYLGALLEGETVILIAGVLCHRGTLPLDWTVVVAALGAFSGDQFWFRLGRAKGSLVLDRYPRLAATAERIRPWVQDKADWIALGSRFIYGTRSASPLLLGIEGYPSLRFALFNGCSAILWALLGVGLGYLIGDGVERLLGPIEHIEQLLLAIVAVMAAWWWYRRRAPANAR
jgi:membrane protein DedA with SNARE-associated domain